MVSLPQELKTLQTEERMLDQQLVRFRSPHLLLGLSSGLLEEE